MEGAHSQSELRRRVGSRSPAAADDAPSPKTRKQGWIKRLFRRVWAGLGSLFRKLFRKNAA
ncbi:hypothetical protein IMZ48_00125 [Candidatus Bathyarchaeota archaeon]|nr:hypothetical protein [Candidatus Bathyarchaeota archaeon]